MSRLAIVFMLVISGGAALGDEEGRGWHLDESMNPKTRPERTAELAGRYAEKREQRWARRCESGAAWACYHVGLARGDVALLERACDGGVAPACTEAGARLRDSGLARATRRLRRGCALGDLDACDALDAQ